MIRGLKQVALYAPDLETSVAFYRDVLGLEHQATFDPPGLAFFQLGDGTRLLLDRAEATPRSLLYYAVDDIHVAADMLHRRGVTMESQPHVVHTHDGTFDAAGVQEWMVFFRDPADNLAALVSRVIAD